MARRRIVVGRVGLGAGASDKRWSALAVTALEHLTLEPYRRVRAGSSDRPRFLVWPQRTAGVLVSFPGWPQWRPQARSFRKPYPALPSKLIGGRLLAARRLAGQRLAGQRLVARRRRNLTGSHQWIAGLA